MCTCTKSLCSRGSLPLRCSSARGLGLGFGFRSWLLGCSPSFYLLLKRRARGHAHSLDRGVRGAGWRFFRRSRSPTPTTQAAHTSEVKIIDRKRKDKFLIDRHEALSTTHEPKNIWRAAACCMARGALWLARRVARARRPWRRLRVWHEAGAAKQWRS